MRVEILRGKAPSETADAMLRAMEAAIRRAGDEVTLTPEYRGDGVLMLFGVGARVHDEARRKHLERGGRVVLFDLGYFGRKKLVGYLKMSLDRDHPQHLLDATPTDPRRWDRLGIALREDADLAGPVILAGLGRKSRAYLNLPCWEIDKLKDLRARFPGRRVIYRPKGRDRADLGIETNAERPIADLLRGASLAVVRHSNVAIDAVVAGVPFEAEEGAAMWLQGREYTAENRLDFLRRLAHWQYRPDEAADAWAFAREMMERT